MINNLPPHSRYKLALEDDDELREEVIAYYGGKMPPSRPPSLDSWTAMDEMLAVITDGLNAVQHAIIAVNTPKGKPRPKFTPVRRPKTAADRAESRREWRTHQEIVRLALPHKEG